jgi:hypothetical protein
MPLEWFRRRTFILLALVAASILLYRASAQEPPTPDTLRKWGLETLDQIQAALWIPTRGLYAEATVVGQPAPDQPAFMWGSGVQLSALVAATRLDAKVYQPQLRRYVTRLDSYWLEANGIGGYDVQPGAAAPDRYYDDNAWIALALEEAFEVTRDRQYLRRAEQTLRFVLSGEDDALGGGLYWHEQARDSKNTCSNAPAATAALRLYQLTHEPKYLVIGCRLYNWTNAHLQDKDGLFFDHIRLDGTLEKTKWSYNSALMLRANGLLYEITREPRYLAEAQQIAHAAEAHWVHPDTGAIADNAAFAHLLAEAFLALYAQDQDTHWLQVVRRALTFLHDQARDPHGWYADQWSTPQPQPLLKITLLDQASAARAFLVAARYAPH